MSRTTLRIVLSGGGSGGHITPILAVAAELKRQQPTAELIYIGQQGDGLLDVPSNDPNIDQVFTVRAGKFRRYHGEGWKQVFDLPTVWKNVRDAAYVFIGTYQSWRLLGQLQPQVLFTRGGFVSVPVAMAARLRGVPYLTHDSDAIPSLANRMIARHAVLHTVALPEEVYSYPIDKTKTVGIPVDAHFVPVTESLQAGYRRELDLPLNAKVLLVTGGGNGAQQLNQLVIDNAAYLLKRYPKLHILHISGRALEATTNTTYKASLPIAELQRVRVLGFVTDLYRYSGAADVIIARGGATNFAEFAVQGRACVIVPPPQLRWSVKNTEELAKRRAIVMLTEDQAEQERRLATVVGELLDEPKRRDQLAARLAQFAKPQAARELATLIIDYAKDGSNS